MNHIGLDLLTAEVAALRTVFPVGRVAALDGNTIFISGISDQAALGDLVRLPHLDLKGEIIALDTDRAQILPDGPTEGVQIGDRVIVDGPLGVAPHASWLGRLVDPFGAPLDGRPILRGDKSLPIGGAPINPADRRGLGGRIETGMTVFNTMLPLVRGQRIGIFAGSGVGKTTLLARFATDIQADVVVIALIGERGREVREFVDKILGPKGMERAVVVAATSDTSAIERRRCAGTAMAIAEYFRDQGQHVLYLADSVTRFADAHREIASAVGGAQGGSKYPSSTTSLITSLCERAGPGTHHSGDITAIFSVLVAGSDMEEPIADILRGVLDGHVVLDRKIAERGRFPAIDVLRSVSRSLPEVATEEENQIINAARQMLGAYSQSEMMIQAGLYAAGTDPLIDAAIAAYPKIDRFLTQLENENTQASFAALAACLVE